MQLILLRKVLLTGRLLPLKMPLPGKAIKLIALLLLLHLFSNSSYAQSISITAKSASLESVLKQVSKQSGYQLFYRKEQMERSFPVTLTIIKGDLNTVLNIIFAEQPFNYSITNKTIVVTPKTLSAPARPFPARGTINVTGRITDKDGQPFPGVTVFVNDINLYTTTNDDGRFNLVEVPPNATLKCFGLSIINLNEDINGRTNINIIAQPKINALQEVVINKGYYTEAQRTTTGDVFTIKGIDLLKTPTNNPILAMEGRVPGLFIQQNSGLPGATQNVLIRGKNSFSNGTGPLYIINGIPYDGNSLSVVGGYSGGYGSASPGGISPLSALNPSDIEEITVLKDADATAIYGSRGANGVILITTKKGKAGKTQASFDLSSGFQRYSRRVDVLNTEQYLAMRKEALRNDGTSPSSYGDYDINGTWDSNRYTNWQKELLNNTARINNFQGSISGGDDNNQFIVNGGYRKQTLVYDYSDGMGDQTGSIHANINHTSINKKFGITFDLGYVYDNNMMPVTDPTRAAITLAPNAPALYNADGTLNWQNSTFQNPLSGSLQTLRSATDNILGNANVHYMILPGLQIKANIGYNKTEMNELALIPGSSLDPASVAAGYAQRSAGVGQTTNRSWIAEPQINYDRAIAKGKLSVLIGSTFQQSTKSSNGFNAIGAPNDSQLQNYATAQTITYYNQVFSKYNYNALYARINYNWDAKYIVNITARRDGSSRFGSANQFGNFGAVGAAWIFSDEPLLKKVTWLSLGKLRASYGITGNDQIGDYSYVSTYTPNQYSYGGTNTISPSALANPNISWEKNKKLEVGLDLGFFNDRVNLTANYYRNRSSNQLVYTALPDIAGISLVLENLPATIQNRGFEALLNTTNIRNNSFTWKSSFNFSMLRNKLLSFPNIAQSAYNQIYTVGQPTFTGKRYHYTGVDPATGVYTFEDVNKDGLINQADMITSKQITPDYYGGFNNSFSYKGFQLDIFFQYVKQTGFSYLAGFSAPGSLGNVPVEALQRWQTPGDVTALQRFTTGSFGSAAGTAYSNFAQSDGLIVNTSFIRLKNATLGYTLPQIWSRKMRITNAQVYVTGDNLLTMTHFVGADPESGSNILPPLRTILVGLRLSL